MSSSTSTKRCTKCGEIKPLGAFYRAPANRDGRRGDCKDCNLAAKRKWYEQNRERAIERARTWQRENRARYQDKQRRYREANRDELSRKNRERHLQKTFGITLADYVRMLEEQGFGCGICGDAPPEGGSFHVDHDPRSGRVRGLLCVRCNNGLGQFRDTSSLLRSAIDYLHRGPGLVELVDHVALARERAAFLTREASV